LFKFFRFHRLTKAVNFRVNDNFYWFRNEFSLRSCFRCNTQVSKISNFKSDYLGNNNDSEVAVKTKNAPFLW